ncbi:MAG: heme ABC transporter ATP-binding protein [Candidatus Alcyoniella australis]|nr:heme ABC transporter ATP-binding protein [Candidatus Alcyoniella australis]
MSGIAIHDAVFSYSEKPVLDGLTLDVRSGSFVGIVGPNGSGKSTLLKLLGGLLKPQQGRVEIDGKELDQYSRRQVARSMALIPQQLGTQYPFSVEQVVLMGRHPHKGLAPFETAEDLALARQAMEECGIEHLAHRAMPQLSGGEQQRVMVAAALAQQPKILLADEPTSSLDLHFQVEIYRILQRLNRSRNVTVIAVTHDLNLAAMFCPRIVMLSKGTLRADGTAAQVIRPELLSEVYDAEVLVADRPDADLPYVLPAVGDLKR